MKAAKFNAALKMKESLSKMDADEFLATFFKYICCSLRIHQGSAEDLVADEAHERLKALTNPNR